jgi:hypothetical protein
LTFKLAILAHLRRPPASSPEVQAQSRFIRVVQVLSGNSSHAGVTGLVAQQLYSFQEELVVVFHSDFEVIMSPIRFRTSAIAMLLSLIGLDAINVLVL